MDISAEGVPLGTGVYTDHQRPNCCLSQLLSGPSPPNACVSVRWSRLLKACLSPPLLAPPSLCFCGRKPPTFQCLDPALGLPPHRPLTTFQSSLPPCSLLLPRPKAPMVRKRMELALQGIIATQALPRNLLRGLLGLDPAPRCLPDQSSGEGRSQGLSKVVITLWPLLPTHPAGGDFSTILRLCA